MPKKSSLFLIVIWLGSGFLYSFVSLIKHWHFQTGLDLAIYNQTLWFYSHFKLPYVTLYPTFGRLVWADHFTPTLFLLTPFYALFPQAETLLIAQSLFFTSGAIPLYLIAKEKTKSLCFSLAVAVAYVIFFGSQFSLTFDFHAATFGASFLPWILYFLEKSRWKTFFLLVILALGAKEDMALAILSLGIFMLFKSEWRRMGWVTVAISAFYFGVVIFRIIPTFSQGMAKEYVAANLPTDFSGWVSFILSPSKLKTVFLSFASFGFLPLLAPSTWVFPFTHFFYNFLGPSGRWDIYLHYRVTLAPLLAYSSIYGVLNLTRFWKKYLSPNLTFKVGGTLLFFCLLMLQYFLHLPLNSLAKKDFYRQKVGMEENKKLIKMVPSGVSVSTQNHLAPHLSGRKRLFYFPATAGKVGFPDRESGGEDVVSSAKENYVILDLRQDQPLANFWASPEPGESKRIIEEWIKNGKYQVVQKSGESILLKEKTE